MQYINLVLKPMKTEHGGWSESVTKFSCKTHFHSGFSEFKRYLVLEKLVFFFQKFLCSRDNVLFFSPN